MTKLTPQEFDMLQQAMESHKSRIKEGNLIGDLMVGMLTYKLSPEEKEAMKKSDEDGKTQQREKDQVILEAITVLQAKLILMKDQIIVSELLS